MGTHRRAAGGPGDPAESPELFQEYAAPFPAEDAKAPVSIRLDAEVLDYFKAGARGYGRSQQRRGTR